tara:strand:+ start:2837 stop:3397 length:561 start_codon:yes stop_codon:yes gene_type:complete
MIFNSKNKPIGIFGGSFDPPHNGHLQIVKHSLRKLKLKKIYWVVTKKNPLKKRTLFSINQRIEKSKRIVGKSKKIRVVYFDKIIKSSKSYKVINFLLKRERTKSLYFIMGSDNLITLHKWENWKKILELTKVIVFSRKGYDKKAKKIAFTRYNNNKNIIFIKSKKIDISSSSIRRKIFRINGSKKN